MNDSQVNCSTLGVMTRVNAFQNTSTISRGAGRRLGFQCVRVVGCRVVCRYGSDDGVRRMRRGCGVSQSGAAEAVAWDEDEDGE